MKLALFLAFGGSSFLVQALRLNNLQSRLQSERPMSVETIASQVGATTENPALLMGAMSMMGGGGGGGAPPQGPVTQNGGSVNIINNNRNLTAPAGALNTGQEVFNYGFGNAGSPAGMQ